MKKEVITREEAEKMIFEHVKAIKCITETYYPEDKYLFIAITSKGNMFFNNAYWEHKEEGVIKFWKGGTEE